MAGGFEIVLSCDLVVAADDARFGLPEVKRGLFASAGGLVRLPKRVPLALATEVAITGEPIDAGRAHALGLVNRVVPSDKVVDEALALAALIAENAPVAVRSSLAHGARGGRPDRGRRAGGATARSQPRSVVDQGRDRGRHRLRREAQAELDGCLTARS